jgi:hypothetical protein
MTFHTTTGPVAERALLARLWGFWLKREAIIWESLNI